MSGHGVVYATYLSGSRHTSGGVVRSDVDDREPAHELPEHHR